MTRSSSPTLLKWYVALELRRLREAAGISRQQVADHLDCALSTVRHIENGRNLPRPLELKTILALYGVPDRSERFVELVKAARSGTDWFTPFKGSAPPWFDLFLGLESSAQQIQSYDAHVIPGLFQTEEYARAVVHAGDPELGDAEMDRRIELRMARQDVLARDDPPTVWSVLDESVLHRSIEDPAAMQRQWYRLAEIAELPHVTIQVEPLRRGPHAGLNGTFVVMEFPHLDGSPAVAYTDGMIQGSYYEEPEEVRRYRNALTRLQIDAARPAESLAMITQHAKESP